MKRLLPRLIFLFSLTSESGAQAVNLSACQTPIRNQGTRTTCITSAALASVKAAYKRACYGDLQLSEESGWTPAEF